MSDGTTAADGPLTRLRARLEGPNTVGNSRLFWAGFGVVLALVLAYPLVRGAYAASQLTLYYTYVFLALSLSLVWGYTGILSFGQVVFFGVAGYSYGIISLNVGGLTGSTLGLVGSVVLTTVAAFALGYFMFYGGLRGDYVTITTLAVTVVLHVFMIQTAGDKWMIGDVSLGGANGIVGIPDVGVGVGEAGVVVSGVGFYYLVVALLVVTYLGMRVLVNGRAGYAMVAVREDEGRTEMLGYDTKRVKLLVWTAGGALAGVGGTLYTAWGNFVHPGVFELVFASLPVIWCSLGGRETLLGAMIGAIVIPWFSNELAITGSQWAIVIVGVLLLVTVLLFPDGFVPNARRQVTALLARRGPDADPNRETDDGPEVVE